MKTAEPLHLERKTFVSTVWALVGFGALAVLNGLNNSQVLANLGVPAWAQPLLITLIPTAIVAVSGYISKHTSRPDLGAVPSAGSPVVAPVPAAPAVDVP